MTGQLTLTARDLHQLLDVVDPGHRRDGDSTGQADDLVPTSVLTRIAELVGCDDVTVQVADFGARRIIGTQSLLPEGPAEDDDELFWLGFWECLACSYPQRTGDFTSVTLLSDFYGDREFARLAMASYYARVGMRREMLVPLPPIGPTDRRILLWRADDVEFSERDRMAMSVLRPHLAEDLNRQTPVQARVPRQTRGRDQVPLTVRQWELLRLVASGYSNKQIARKLFVSEGTVRKHLENIFERLEVSSRTAAVARMGPALHAVG